MKKSYFCLFLVLLFEFNYYRFSKKAQFPSLELSSSGTNCIDFSKNCIGPDGRVGISVPKVGESFCKAVFTSIK